MATATLPERPQALIQEVRKRLLAQAASAMAALGSVIQQRLTALLEQAAPAMEMYSRRETWTTFQSQQPVWLAGTLNQWQLALRPVNSAPVGVLELLGTEVVEHQIIASRLAWGMMDQIAADLHDLHLRIRYLEKKDEIGAADLLQPEVLLLPMVAQWEQVGLSREVWPLIMEVVQQFLGVHLQQAYAHCNAYLIEQDVLPTIEQKNLFKRAALARKPAPVALAGAQIGAGSVASRYGSATDETRMMTATTPLARARTRALDVVGQLKQLLTGSAQTNFETDRPQAPTPALMSALAVRPPSESGASQGGELERDGGANVATAAMALRQRSAELKSKAETKSEKALIEIVALMFQAILQEDRLPPGIRVWFARLQMPVLRLALAEPDFFGTINHPARQLIDRMGSCVMGFDASAVSGGALELEIRRLVGMIEQYPETGKRVYQIAQGEFQAFLERFLTGSAATQKLVSVAQQVEQKETLTIQYTIEMRNMLKNMPVRDEIRDFLFKVWAEVLAVAAVRQGPQHAQTLEFKKWATDLVWAASAKPNRSDRARVIQKLPQLVQGLRSGMTLLGVGPTEQEAHIKTVSETLADAFLAKTQAIPSEQIEAMGERLARLEDLVSDDDAGDLPLDAQSIEMLLGIEESVLEVVADGGVTPSGAMLAWAQELELGAWFKLDHNARVAQVQFLWRSERKHLHLFASTDGRSYLLQAGRLAAYLQAGLLSPDEEEALTVRATRDALVKLDANPERLLA